jgi:hypothetical protein
MNKLRRIIDECVRRALYEGGYWDETATPLVINGTTPTRDFIGHNPGLDNGPEKNPSQITPDEENFISQDNIVISDNQFIIYQIKNFGNDKIDGTMNFFGNSTVELARAIHTMNGAAKRNGKQLYYRTITSESNKKTSVKTQQMLKTFWEFSFNGEEWYIMKPHPVQSLKISKFIKK